MTRVIDSCRVKMDGMEYYASRELITLMKVSLQSKELKDDREGKKEGVREEGGGKNAKETVRRGKEFLNGMSPSFLHIMYDKKYI